MSDEAWLVMSFTSGFGVGLIIVGLVLLRQYNQWKKDNHK